MKTRIIVVGLILLLAGANVWQFMVIIDRAVTKSYADGELYNLNQEKAQLEKIVSHFIVGKSVAQTESVLQELFPEELIYIKEGYIQSGALSFKLKPSGDKVERVGG